MNANAMASLSLVEFEQVDGDVVLINSLNVASVEERNGRVRITMKNSTNHIVTGTIQEAQIKLEEG